MSNCAVSNNYVSKRRSSSRCAIDTIDPPSRSHAVTIILIAESDSVSTPGPIFATRDLASAAINRVSHRVNLLVGISYPSAFANRNGGPRHSGYSRSSLGDNPREAQSARLSHHGTWRHWDPGSASWISATIVHLVRCSRIAQDHGWVHSQACAGTESKVVLTEVISQ